MTYSYFPGCTLRNKAKELDLFARASAEVLGFSLEEVEDWQCCGGTYPLSTDEIAIKLSSIRVLSAAQQRNQKLITICSACHNVIKQVNNCMQTDENTVLKANNYLSQENALPYYGETQVLHYLEILRDEIGWNNVKSKVIFPFKGKKIAAYYGCLLLRPGKVMQMDDPENPKIIEDFITAIGAVPVKYSMRNECCGAYTMFEDESIPQKRSNSVLEDALNHGADLMVTACPLCRYNLVKNAGSRDIEILYFTDLLAQALGIKEKALANPEVYYASK